MSKTIVPGLPAEGFVRMQQIVGDPGVSEEQAAKLSTPDKPVAPRPAQPGVLPVTEQQVRYMIRNGQFPAPVKMGPKIALFRVEEVREWIANAGSAKRSDLFDEDSLEEEAVNGDADSIDEAKVSEQLDALELRRRDSARRLGFLTEGEVPELGLHGARLPCARLGSCRLYPVDMVAERLKQSVA